jgi:hypothetical protein
MPGLECAGAEILGGTGRGAEIIVAEGLSRSVGDESNGESLAFPNSAHAMRVVACA